MFATCSIKHHRRWMGTGKQLPLRAVRINVTIRLKDQAPGSRLGGHPGAPAPDQPCALYPCAHMLGVAFAEIQS